MKVSTSIKKFIHEHGFVTVTSGFMIAHAGSNLIESIINGFIMQLIQPLLGNVHWAKHELAIGPFSFQWGNIFASGLHLLTVFAVIVFLIQVFQYEEDREHER